MGWTPLDVMGWLGWAGLAGWAGWLAGWLGGWVKLDGFFLSWLGLSKPFARGQRALSRGACPELAEEGLGGAA